MRQVHSAAQQVNLQEFIESLPGGFDEPVKERGQRFPWVRSSCCPCARPGAQSPHPVLDEATSSVDPETEHLLREGMRRLIENRTSLVIAHRLSTIQNASKIVVLHKGRVARKWVRIKNCLTTGGYTSSSISFSIRTRSCQRRGLRPGRCQSRSPCQNVPNRLAFRTRKRRTVAPIFDPPPGYF